MKVYYGRENIDKEQFMYEQIAQSGHQALVLVPDQYTLEAERQALKYMGTKVLLNIEIMSLSRLGNRILKDIGGDTRTFIDKYGRTVLLSHITKDMTGFEAFQNIANKAGFIDMLNDCISQMKQANVSIADIEKMEAVAESKVLKSKLNDIKRIFSAYEEALKDKYTDSEDLISLYTSGAETWDFLKDKDVWIYGFDSFAPKMIDFIVGISKGALSTNLLMTYDYQRKELFEATRRSIRKFEETLDLEKIKIEIEAKDIASGIEHIEKHLFSTGKYAKPKTLEGVEIVRSSNIYNEIEGAAAFLLEQVRDNGYRYDDVAILCNDESHRIPAIKRVFREYGMDVFIDSPMGIVNTPLIVYMLSLLEVVENAFSSYYIVKAMKSGKSSLSRQQWEELEDYVLRFNIRGSMWKKEFTLGGNLSHDGVNLEEINGYRLALVNPFLAMEKLYKDAKQQGYSYKLFLAMYCKLVADLELVKTDDEAKVWKGYMGLIDQIVSLIGEESLDLEALVALLKAGLSDMTVGELPDKADSVILGTMQRTRIPPKKIVMVMGANEGILPTEINNVQIFSDDELEFLGRYKAFGNPTKHMVQEEKLGIYRNLARASQKLRISYSLGNSDGDALLPSEVVTDIISMAKEADKGESLDFLKDDPFSQGKAVDVIGGSHAVARHLTQQLLRKKNGEIANLDKGWSVVARWLHENKRASFDGISAGLNFRRPNKNLKKDTLHKLYNFERAASMTPYKLEAFSQCPFKYFFSYGLRPSERRVFHVDSRALGDFYHLVMEGFCRRLDNYRDEGGDLEKFDVKASVDEIIAEEAVRYQESLFTKNSLEGYKLRRIRRLCYAACEAITGYYQGSKIKRTFYETEFGTGEAVKEDRYDIENGILKPIEIIVGDLNVVIRGKIDRLDLLEDGSVSVLDYKTGSTSYSEEQVLAGYSMQLLIYLRAAENPQHDEYSNGIGSFYMRLVDKKIELKTNESMAVNVLDKKKKTFLFDGVAREAAKSVMDEFAISRRGIVKSDEEFASLENAVYEHISMVCRDLADGDISISPMKLKSKNACDYCKAKDLCRFDTTLPGYKYRYK